MSQAVYIRPLRSIGGLQFDVTIEESHSDTLEITEHPVEQGASITDHAYMLPSTLTIVAGVSDSGIEGHIGRAKEMYQALRELQGKREPLDVYTGKRVYKNMLISSLATTTDEQTENSLIVTCELQQIITASAQTVRVPRHRQHNGHVTGGTDTRGHQQLEKTDPPKKRKSLLKIGMGG